MFNSFLTTFKFPFFHFTFSTETLAHLISFNPTVIAKTRGDSPSGSSRASALKQSYMSSSPSYSALHLLSTILARAMTSGVLESTKILSSGDVRSSPVPGGVPAKTTGQCTLVFS